MLCSIGQTRTVSRGDLQVLVPKYRSDDNINFNYLDNSIGPYKHLWTFKHENSASRSSEHTQRNAKDFSNRMRFSYFFCAISHLLHWPSNHVPYRTLSYSGIICYESNAALCEPCPSSSMAVISLYAHHKRSLKACCCVISILSPPS